MEERPSVLNVLFFFYLLLSLQSCHLVERDLLILRVNEMKCQRKSKRIIQMITFHFSLLGRFLLSSMSFIMLLTLFYPSSFSFCLMMATISSSLSSSRRWQRQKELNRPSASSFDHFLGFCFICITTLGWIPSSSLLCRSEADTQHTYHKCIHSASLIPLHFPMIAFFHGSLGHSMSLCPFFDAFLLLTLLLLCEMDV